jgi:hypothetical protein
MTRNYWLLLVLVALSALLLTCGVRLLLPAVGR